MNKAQKAFISYWHQINCEGTYSRMNEADLTIFAEEFGAIDPTSDPDTYKIVYLREGDLEGTALNTGLTLKEADERIRRHLIDTLTEADANLDSSSYRQDRQITWCVSATVHRIIIVMED